SMPVGEKIAFWAEKFVGVPYDADPLGVYVTRRTLVADDRVDCMYLTFRALELALGLTPEESLDIALDKRFMTRGRVESGVVMNYEDRFQYGEDMIDSGKWGRELTGDLGPLTLVEGTRGRGQVGMLSKETARSLFREGRKSPSTLRSGDFMFFLKSPESRVADEMVGHIGIVTQDKEGLFLIHASGKKNKEGIVRKVSLYDYLNSMPFAGVRVTRYY
ncbi:MAG TPA: hypothetical protein VMH06_07795, partial [Thermodesulfovibrionales bacterium]|nr:hypothetical protein [Thermodesulfovibrionales bacterium]